MQDVSDGGELGSQVPTFPSSHPSRVLSRPQDGPTPPPGTWVPLAVTSQEKAQHGHGSLKPWTPPFSDSLSSITPLSPLPRPFDPTHRRTTSHATPTRHSALQYHSTTSSGRLKGHIMEALINLLVCIIPSQIYDVPDHAMLPINNTPHHLNTSTLSSQTMAHNSRKWPSSPNTAAPC